jgi:streptomycin 3"-adenylyltransferase
VAVNIETLLAPRICHARAAAAIIRRVDQATAVASLVRGTLGTHLVALYLYGSAVAGGLRPGSDLDLFALTDRRTSPAKRRELIAGLRPLSSRAARPASWRPVELTIAARPDIEPLRYPPRVDFQSGEWLRAEFDRGEERPWKSSSPDLLIVLAQVRKGSTALFGPAAAEVLPEIPPSDLTRAMTDEIGSLLDDLEPDTANVLLTLARIWHTLATGDFTTKDAAAGWALTQIGDPLRALELARDEYLGTAPDSAPQGNRWPELQAEARSAARLLVGRIERLAGRSYNPER